MPAGPRLRLEAVNAAGPGSIRLDGEPQPSISVALSRAAPGAVIEIGRGRYGTDHETFPLRVPSEVTLVGPAPPALPPEARKHLPRPQPAEVVGDGTLVVFEGNGSRIANVTFRSRGANEAPSVIIDGVGGITLDTCELDGHIVGTRCPNVTIEWCTINNAGIRIEHGDAFSLRGGRVAVEPAQRDDGVILIGGSDARIEATVITAASTGLQLTGTTGTRVTATAILDGHVGIEGVDAKQLWLVGNRLVCRNGIHLARCDDVEVTANSIEWDLHAFDHDACTNLTVGSNLLSRHQTIHD